MPNRNQDYQGRRGGRDRDDERRYSSADQDRDYGSYTENDEGDSSVRAGSYDQGRSQYGQYGSRDPHGSRESREGSQGEGNRGRYSGYGDFGQGDYGGGRQGSSGQERNRQSGYGQSGYGQGGYGQSGYGGGYGGGFGGGGEFRGGNYGGEVYGGANRSGSSYGGGVGSSGNEQNYGAGTGRGFSGYGYEGSGSRGMQGSGSSQSGFGQSGYSSEDWQRAGGQTGLHRGKGPKGYQRSDERLKEMICERLRDDPEIDPSEVTINVQGGKVTLEGTVDSRHAKNAIEDAAEQFGVQEVQNNLRVQRATMGADSSRSAAGKSGSEDDRTQRQNKH